MRKRGTICNFLIKGGRRTPCKQSTRSLHTHTHTKHPKRREDQQHGRVPWTPNIQQRSCHRPCERTFSLNWCGDASRMVRSETESSATGRWFAYMLP